MNVSHDHVSHSYPKVKAGVAPSRLSLWSQMGAAGPFTNSKGQPLEDLAMKCVCNSISDKADRSKIDYYTLKVLTPPECHQSKFFNRLRYPKAVPCDGTFSSQSQPNGTRTSDLFQSYVDEGLDLDLLKEASVLEASNLLPFRRIIAVQVVFKELRHRIEACRQKI